MSQASPSGRYPAGAWVNPSPGIRQITSAVEGLLLFSLVFAFYALTLAPTVLWSDSAHFQRQAALGLLDRDGGGRLLWFAAARLMQHLPFGDPALRANLLSAVAGAVTVALVYQAGRAARLSRGGAFTAAAVLAVSHTFWQHAVRAEVYTAFTALLAFQLWLAFRWQRGQLALLLAAVALCGPLLLTHQMAVLLAPALVFLCVKRRDWLAPRQWTAVALAAITSGALTLAILCLQMQAGPAAAIWRYLTHFGIDFSPALFNFSLARWPKDAFLFAFYLLLQFPGPAILLSLLTAVAVLRKKVSLDARWQALLVLALVDILFAFAYRVNDRYVFYLPLYLVCALFVGLGWDGLKREWKAFGAGWLQTALCVLLVATPPLSYATAANLTNRLGFNPLDVRSLPGRDPNRYFLWPALNGYDGAKTYARDALAVTPPGSVIIADYTPYEVLAYAQEVEGQGQGVRLLQVLPEADLGALIGGLPQGSQVFLADSDPRYYNLASLRGASLQPAGLVYHLQR